MGLANTVWLVEGRNSGWEREPGVTVPAKGAEWGVRSDPNYEPKSGYAVAGVATAVRGGKSDT